MDEEPYPENTPEAAAYWRAVAKARVRPIVALWLLAGGFAFGVLASLLGGMLP